MATLASFLLRTAREMGDLMPSGFDAHVPGRAAARAVPPQPAVTGTEDDMPLLEECDPGTLPDRVVDPVALYDSDADEEGDTAALETHAANAADHGCVYRLPVKTKRTVYGWYVTAMRALGEPAYSEANFTAYWKKLAPHIKTARRGKDNFSACNKCVAFKNDLLKTSLTPGVTRAQSHTPQLRATGARPCA